MRTLIYVLSLFLLFFCGCQQSKKETQPRNVLRINFQDGDLPSTHPHIGIDYRMRSLQSALFEGLTRLDQTGTPQPAAAESIHVSDDQKRYTFSIRPASWSNGEYVTAYQFAKAWKEAIAKGSACRRPDLFYLIKNAEKVKKGELPLRAVGIQALDAKTFQVELEHPAPYFLELIANPIFSPLYDESEEPTIYNGPFTIDTWKHDEIIVLKKNPLYWDAQTVTLNRLEIFFITDPLTAEQLFEKGKLDWIGSPFSCLPTSTIPFYQKTGKLSVKEVDRVYWLYCNSTQAPYSNPSIRKALAYAINRQAIVDHVFFGQLAATAPLPLGLSLLSDKHLPNRNETQLAQHFFQQGLQELGLTPQTFPSLTLSHSHITGQQQLAEVIQSNWKEVLGIDVTLEGAEWNVFFSDLSRGDFHVGGCLKSALFKDPIYHLELLEDKEHAYNISRWENAQYQNFLEKARLEPNPEKRKGYLRDAEEILVEEMPVIPIYSEAYLYLIRPHIQNVVIHDLGHVDFKWTHINH